MVRDLEARLARASAQHEEELKRQRVEFEKRETELRAAHERQTRAAKEEALALANRARELERTTAEAAELTSQGELELQKARRAAAAREEELLEQLEQSGAATEAAKAELQAALDKAGQHTLRIMELNASYEVARAEFEDRSRSLRMRISELTEQLTSTTSAGEIATSRAKAAESKLETLRALVAAGEKAREAADAAADELRDELAQETHRADGAENAARVAEERVTELEV